MDRNISYAGQVPRALDFLRTGEFAMVGLAKLAEAMLGTSTVVSQGGFAVTPGGGLNIAVGPGQIYQLQSIEPTSLSALNADGRQVLKQGVALDAQTLTLTPPVAVGYAQSFLIQAAYADIPDGKIILSYQNPTPVLDPGTGALKYVTYPGPGGSGDQQYTILRGGVSLNPKPGAAAPAGQQTIPAPDAGYVGLYVVTLAYGATSIAGGNIAPYAGAPFIPLSLVQVAAREIATVQSAGLSPNGGDPTEMAQALGRGIWVDNLTGTGDLAVATLGVVLPSFLKGMRIGGVATAANTVTNPKLRVVNLGSVGGYTDFPILKEDGSALAVGEIKAGRRYRYEADGAGNVLISGGGMGATSGGLTLVTAQTLYVRPDGNDANDGSASDAGHALQTIAAAITASYKYLTTGAPIIIKLAIPGTYFAFGAPNLAARYIKILGDPANQGAYVIQGPGTYGIPLVGCTNGSMDISGLTVSNTGTVSDSVAAGAGGRISVDRLTFQCAAGNVYADLAEYGGTLSIGAGMIFSSSRGCWLTGLGGSVTFVTGATLTWTGTPTYSVAGLSLAGSATLSWTFGAQPTVTGAANGPRFLLADTSCVHSYGAGETVFPGSSPGVKQNNAVYS